MSGNVYLTADDITENHPVNRQQYDYETRYFAAGPATLGIPVLEGDVYDEPVQEEREPGKYKPRHASGRKKWFPNFGYWSEHRSMGKDRKRRKMRGNVGRPE